MALYLYKELDDDYHSKLGVWQVSETEAELRALSSIPSDELEEISYIKSESLRKQKLAVRALLDVMFEDKVYLSHHDNGKPYIENCATNISITHTDKYVAVLLNDTEEIGVDCESLDRDFSAVEKKALSEEEIDDLDDDKRNEQLAIYWCAKEAVYKKMSQHNVDFAEQIEIEDFHPRGEGKLDAVFTEKDGYEEEIHLQYMTFDRHVLVWVSSEE
ncbi:MAG: 4'-phosphopantetheinyl transferase superfamily protein [Bacteroidales bacterium]|nr:4'-phosphopantetheinyl transferase superfamily protein [Bacteroidales bacterium]